MIKVADNLQFMLGLKCAKEERKKRKVDYAGRAARGAQYGAISGALLGALGGTHYPQITGVYEQSPLIGGIIGALGGGLLGSGVGAAGNMLSGYINEDIITGQLEPNRLRRAGVGGILGAIGGLGAASLGSFNTEKQQLAALLLGGLGGAAGGALGGGVIGPWLNRDIWENNRI
jgi:hypothetical protein